MKQVCIFLLLWTLPVLLCAQPDRDWATYYGISVLTNSVRYDSSHNYTYITGTTVQDTGIATPGTYKSMHTYADDSVDIFLLKFDTAGNRIWGTYFGGSGQEYLPQITIDGTGNIYLAGNTTSASGIASSGAWQPSFQNTVNTYFLAKFDAEGQLLWSTYYGDSVIMPPNAVTTPIGYSYLSTDNQGHVYLAGATAAFSGIASAGAFQEQLNNDGSTQNRDAFIAKFDSSGNRLWGTYLGTDANERCGGMAVDSAGNIFISGNTNSLTGMATPGAWQEEGLDTLGSGFLARFNSNGQRTWCTYFGGPGREFPVSLTIDNDNNIYLYGNTNTLEGLSTPETWQPDFGGGLWDIFLLKYNSEGQKQWGTYFGGSGSDMQDYGSSSIQISPEQDALYICGRTESADQIRTSCTYPAVHNQGFLAKFSLDGNLAWGSYYDAPVQDIDVGQGKDLYICTYTYLDNLATPGAFMELLPPNSSAGLIAKFTDTLICPQMTVTLTLSDSIFTADPPGLGSYAWYADGELLQSGTDNHLPLSAGMYGSFSVTVTDSCGCIYTSDNRIEILDPSGIHAVAGAFPVHVFPNPATDAIYLEYPADVSVLQLVLQDISGRALQSFPAGAKMLRISGIAPGWYLLKIITNKGIGVKKLIRQAE